MLPACWGLLVRHPLWFFGAELPENSQEVEKATCNFLSHNSLQLGAKLRAGTSEPQKPLCFKGFARIRGDIR